MFVEITLLCWRIYKLRLELVLVHMRLSKLVSLQTNLQYTSSFNGLCKHQSRHNSYTDRKSSGPREKPLFLSLLCCGGCFGASNYSASAQMQTANINPRNKHTHTHRYIHILYYEYNIVIYFIIQDESYALTTIAIEAISYTFTKDIHKLLYD